LLSLLIRAAPTHPPLVVSSVARCYVIQLANAKVSADMDLLVVLLVIGLIAIAALVISIVLLERPNKRGCRGRAGVAGGQGSVGVQGATGLQGPEGAASATGATGPPGTQGATGSQGPAGSQGASGSQGATGAAGGSSSLGSAMFATLGSQPAPVAAAEPFTYSAVGSISSSNITASTDIFNPPFSASGTVFTLVNIGRYQITWQMSYPTDDGVCLYFGSSIAAMAPLPYTMVGKTAATEDQVSGNVIIVTTTTSSFLAVVAAAGNGSAIDIPPDSSTTNASSTTVSIVQIA
jgi:hypothetical protein